MTSFRRRLAKGGYITLAIYVGLKKPKKRKEKKSGQKGCDSERIATT